MSWNFRPALKNVNKKHSYLQDYDRLGLLDVEIEGKGLSQDNTMW